MPDLRNAEQPPALSTPTTGATAAVPKGRAFWTPEDQTRLLDYLVLNKSEGDGDGSFKVTIWRGAVAHVNVKLTRGGKKTDMSCKGKYQSLKSTYEVVCKVWSNSG